MVDSVMAFGFDPTLSAFLRAMGVSEQDIYAQTRQQTDMAANAFDRQLPVFAEQARKAVESVSNDAESRGVYRSGATLVNMTRARTDVLAQQEEARQQMLDAQASLRLDAARQVAELRRRAAEEELAARTRQAEGAARSSYGA